MQSATPGLFISIFGIFISSIQIGSSSDSYEMNYENIFNDQYEGSFIPCNLVNNSIMKLKSILHELEIISDAHCLSQTEGPGEGARSMPIPMNHQRVFYPMSQKLRYGRTYMLPHRQHYQSARGQNLYNYPGQTYTVLGPLSINGHHPFTHHQIAPNQIHSAIPKKPINLNFNPPSFNFADNDIYTTQMNKISPGKKNEKKKKCMKKKKNKNRGESFGRKNTKYLDDMNDDVKSREIEESISENVQKNSANFTSDSSEESSSSVSD